MRVMRGSPPDIRPCIICRRKEFRVCGERGETLCPQRLFKVAHFNDSLAIFFFLWMSLSRSSALYEDELEKQFRNGKLLTGRLFLRAGLWPVFFPSLTALMLLERLKRSEQNR